MTETSLPRRHAFSVCCGAGIKPLNPACSQVTARPDTPFPGVVQRRGWARGPWRPLQGQNPSSRSPRSPPTPQGPLSTSGSPQSPPVPSGSPQRLAPLTAASPPPPPASRVQIGPPRRVSLRAFPSFGSPPSQPAATAAQGSWGQSGNPGIRPSRCPRPPEPVVGGGVGDSLTSPARKDQEPLQPGRSTALKKPPL